MGAAVVMGEPPEEHKRKVHEHLRAKKQQKADIAWNHQKSERDRKQALAKVQKERAEKEAKRKEEIAKRIAETKKRAAEIKGAEKKEEEEKTDGEQKEAIEGKSVDAEMKPVE